MSTLQSAPASSTGGDVEMADSTGGSEVQEPGWQCCACNTKLKGKWIWWFDYHKLCNNCRDSASRAYVKQTDEYDGFEPYMTRVLNRECVNKEWCRTYHATTTGSDDGCHVQHPVVKKVKMESPVPHLEQDDVAQAGDMNIMD